jgi:hypothetical protein
MFGLQLGKVFGFTQLAWSMMELLDTDGMVYSGFIMVLTLDLSMLLPVILPLHFTNKHKLLVEIKTTRLFHLKLPYELLLIMLISTRLALYHSVKSADQIIEKIINPNTNPLRIA